MVTESINMNDLTRFCPWSSCTTTQETPGFLLVRGENGDSQVSARRQAVVQVSTRSRGLPGAFRRAQRSE